MTPQQIQSDILAFVRASYPAIIVRVAPYPEEPGRLAVTFVDEELAHLYPLQRYHHLMNMIPEDYYREHLADTIWLELAPDESPGDLEYPDDELVEQITPDVMRCIGDSGFFQALDDVLCPSEDGAPGAACHGDFRHARDILLARGFAEDELFDVLHVLMAQGGYCDCEILYNVAEESRLAAEYWRARAANAVPYDPHRQA